MKKVLLIGTGDAVQTRDEARMIAEAIEAQITDRTILIVPGMTGALELTVNENSPGVRERADSVMHPESFRPLPRSDVARHEADRVRV